MSGRHGGSHRRGCQPGLQLGGEPPSAAVPGLEADQRPDGRAADGGEGHPAAGVRRLDAYQYGQCAGRCELQDSREAGAGGRSLHVAEAGG